jgi:hypothetical protein
MHRTFFPLFVAALVGCATGTPACPVPVPADGLEPAYHWHATAGDCVTYHGAAEPLRGVLPESCVPVDVCGGSVLFDCPVPTGTLRYDVEAWWDGDELVGEGTVTRLGHNGVETCSGDVTIAARPAVF